MPPIPIDGRTQLTGLIGWPVEHTMSPTMQNAAFQARGLNWRYVPLRVLPGHAAMAMRGLVALGFRGANVTAPHKEAVLPSLDTVAGAAQTLGAVNTVAVDWEDGGPTASGHNTDAAGFIGALRAAGFEPRGTSAVVVGAGGAARAVVFGLIEAGATRIVVLNRTLERAQALVSDLARKSPFSLTAERLSEETLIEAAQPTSLLVNATPVGTWPGANDSIWPDDARIPSQLSVFDLVYNPQETKLLEQARRSGAQAIDGLGMLVEQGALAFEMWTGEEAPIDLMRSACEQALSGSKAASPVPGKDA